MSTRRGFLTRAGLAGAAMTLASLAEAGSQERPAMSHAGLEPPQPVGAVCQIAYIVADIHREMDRFTKLVGAGPWYLIKDMHLKALDRGRPIEFVGHVAAGYTGHMMIELIQQVNDVPSIFSEVVKSRGYGLHHQAIMVKDFKAQMRLYKSLGYEIAFSPLEPGNPSVMIDTKGDLPFFLEVAQATDKSTRFLLSGYQASQGWDGSNPVRPLGPR